MNKQNDTPKKLIDSVAAYVRILAHVEYKSPVHDYVMNKEILVDTDELSWHKYDDEYCGFLTLEEISEQLLKKGYLAPFTVWYELGLSGKIYVYGNHIPPTWEERGTTRGYA